MRAFLTRISLFLATNLAVLVLLGFVMRITGLDQSLASNGLPLGALLVMAAVMGFGGSFISLALSKTMAKWSTGAVVIQQPSTEVEAWLLRTVADQARRAGIDTPEVAIYPSPDLNAFATGMSRNRALVAVSEGLLRSMSRREVEAVLAHEVSHAANGDMTTMALLQGVLNTFVFFLARVIGYVVDNMLRGSRDEESSGVGLGYFAAVIVSEIALGLLASLIAMAFSRRREFRADAGAARLVGPEAMVDALRKLQLVHAPAQLPRSMNAFGIRDGGGWTRLFMSHPPIPERIAALGGDPS